ncbi:Hypothetical protein SMAX5B_020899 [Scophthalmus maximus]|uniref:Uncharacterized protein n=1 Tax=Scophthalmus maximus TaxID=52904 RepID=A0A2U9CRZ2_SCOMX|nr:Hypothetical protein SMAX5B_020899 [Scophthalmus maximus]
MSLLSVAEQAIESCKAEQTKIHDSIQLYRDILQSLTQQPEPGVEEFDCVDDAAAADADADTSPGEKEDIELLEQALEKALRIRTGFGTSKTDPDRHKQSRPFPKDWPCGSLDQTTAPDDKLIHLGHELTHPCQTKEPLAKVTPEAATELGTRKNKYDSCLTADPVTQELETWDRWRPGGGPLCPTGTNSLWEDGMITPLPLTITYTTEAELQELEKLRMRVALLQQEINLEQALLENLSPQLSSIAPGPGCPNPSVLRDMYSLLGEGGERFPATVLDSESD